MVRYGEPRTGIWARFWPKVEKDSTTGCWNWTACVANNYGQFAVGGKRVRPHRWIYEQAWGPIPEGLTIDHLCRNKLCMNPQHLEAVTMRVNVLRGDTITAANARKTHCKRGHPFTDDNIYWATGGRRECLTCKRELARAYWAKKTAA